MIFKLDWQHWLLTASFKLSKWRYALEHKIFLTESYFKKVEQLKIGERK
jgi:hypothetical protein